MPVSTAKTGLLLATVVAWLAVIGGLQDEKEAVRIALLALATIISVALFMQPEDKKNEYPGTVSGKGDSYRKKYEIYDLNDKKKSFEKICQVLIDETIEELDLYETQSSEKEWIRKVLEYNTMGGKMNRGLMVVEAGILLFKGTHRKVTNDDLNRFAVLGWCVEWLQAWLLVADDYMDSSVTRRGQPCWYRNDGVDKIALNDAFVIEMCLFRTLKRHFAHLWCYPQLLDLFLETTFQTEIGQLLDLRCEHVTLEEFTFQRWELIVKYKTAFYSFYLPVALAMTMAGINDRKEFEAARNILVTMGIYFQAQDDYLDAFGSPEQIGKIGTDIQDKKCGWLFVQAYHKLANPEQKAFLQKNYGNCKVQSDTEKDIKALYKELDLPKIYADYEQTSYDHILSLKHSVKFVPWSVFEAFLNKIYKRQK